MKVSNKKKAVILGTTLVALGAGAIGTSAVVAQQAGAESYAQDGGMRHADWRGGKRGHHDGFGGKRGGAMMMGVFEDVDADGDGAVTQEEIDTYRAERVGAVDASGDGALDIQEFDTLYREFTRPHMVDAFQRLDDDGDGTISEAEMDARFGNIVERMDRDGDGALSPEDRGRRDRS